MKALDQRHPFSIGHVAKVTGVSVSTLRAWERQGLLSPHKSAGGHRTFSADDIGRVRRIEGLRRMSGNSLSSIRRALEDEAGPTGRSAAAVEPSSEQEFSRIGAQVRALRQDARMSLRDLSERTDIAVSHLSMFERGAAYLSPARLSAIASVFERSLAELLGGTSERGFPVVRRGSGRIVGTFGPGVTVEQLTVAQHLMDAEVWTIEAGRESDGFYSHEGEELIYLLEGELEVTLADRDPEVLHAGDCAYFSSRIAHRWRNLSDHAAVVLWVNTDVERIGSMGFDKSDRRLGLGMTWGTGLGEGALNITLPEETETYRVIETHTAGHPTRILVEPLEGLDGPTVEDKARQFRASYDDLRSLLLHEPRGHSGSFGLVPVASRVADFGAFFVASYGYPRMCGHAVIGYAKALQALGRLPESGRFTMEVPGGVLAVRTGLYGVAENVSIVLPPARVVEPERRVHAGGRTLSVCVAFGGNWYAVVDAKEAGIELVPARIEGLLALAEELKTSINTDPERSNGGLPAIDAVLFHEDRAEGLPRQFLAIGRNKYDRSPGPTGLAARLAQLSATGRIAIGQALDVESVFGGRLRGEVLSAEQDADGNDVWIPQITGQAHLNGISTLIHEKSDPWGGGFEG